MLENPVDPGPPFPSFWCSPSFGKMRQVCEWTVVTGDQCMCGAPTRKRTILAGNLENLEDVGKLRCNHKMHSKMIGYDSAQRKFATQILSQYPSALCEFMARRMLASWMSFGSGLRPSLHPPEPFHGLKGLTPSGRERHPLPRPLHVWPAQSGRLLAEPPDGGLADPIPGCPPPSC